MELAVSNSQILICVSLVALCFLTSRMRSGLSIAFCFVFYWGFIENRDHYFVTLENSSPFLAVYFISGILLIAFTLYSFLVEK